MFDINKIRANVPRDLRCRHIVLDKLLNLGIREKLGVDTSAQAGDIAIRSGWI